MLDCNTAPGASAVLDLGKEPAYAGGEVGFFIVTPEAQGGTGRARAATAARPSRASPPARATSTTREQKYNPDRAGAAIVHPPAPLRAATSARRSSTSRGRTPSSREQRLHRSGDQRERVECSGGGVVRHRENGVVRARRDVVREAGARVRAGPRRAARGVQRRRRRLQRAGRRRRDVPVRRRRVPAGALRARVREHRVPVRVGDTSCDPATRSAWRRLRRRHCPSGPGVPRGQMRHAVRGRRLPARAGVRRRRVRRPVRGRDVQRGQMCSAGSASPAARGAAASPARCPGSATPPPGNASIPRARAVPGGDLLRGGQCVDDCDGAKCPNGAACQGGVCGGAGGGSGSSSSGIGVGGSGGAAATSSSSSSGSGVGGADDTTFGPGTKSGCGCRVAGDTDDRDAGVAFGLAGLLAVSLWRRRRDDRRAG